MPPQWVIEKKRDGHALAEDEIRSFIDGYTKGTIPDYQMSALAMAIYFKGMSFDEVTVLTNAMMTSGEVVDTSAIPVKKVDKHSTGGIGDKVSLILAPLAACCGIAVPMISGRGLGVTGGTLDKMESIRGYKADLSIPRFIDVLQKCGCSIIGQTSQLAPADKKLYALRDVTGTVPSIPLISASIMSKKLAEGIDGLVLDVKWGKGAFMKTQEDARELAKTMVEIGQRMGKGMTAVMTDMNQPLGHTVGNALEVIEAIEALKGEGPEDLMEVTLTLTAHMLVVGGMATDLDEAHVVLQKHIDSGAAFENFKTMVELHGGDPRMIDDVTKLPSSALEMDFHAPQSGFIASVDANAIGRACLVLGAGRQTVADRVDHSVGITDIIKIGEKVEEGQPLLVVHANGEDKLHEADEYLADAFTFADEPVTPPDLIVETIGSDG